MIRLRDIIVKFYAEHKRRIIIWTVLILSGGMIFKGLMQRPQIDRNKGYISSLESKIKDERDRQAEVDNLKTKVNTDEYIERIASEKLGLVKSNATIFLDVSDED